LTKSMKRRDVERALRWAGCKPRLDSGRGPHEKWDCPCGLHSVNLPRHREVSPGVVCDLVKRLQCLPKGWLR
jgi:hypothetical protein